jgi:RluA family pseudouridine synthase
MPAELVTRIVWQSEGLVVVDKPAGMLSQPAAGEGPNLVDWARAHFEQSTIAVLHRLDRNVSGLVMLATRKAEARAMSEAFATGTVDRRYAAVVRGVPPDVLVIDAWLDKDESRNLVRARDADALSASDRDAFVAARTEVRLEQRFSALFGRAAVVEARPITGRSHQIRVHLAHVGLPIVGDPKYGLPVRGIDRPLLHARELRFVHPTTGENVVLRAPEPWALETVRIAKKLGHGSRSSR